MDDPLEIISPINDANICLIICLLEPDCYSILLQLSKGIHNNVKPLRDLIVAKYPSFGLYWLVPRILSSELEVLNVAHYDNLGTKSQPVLALRKHDYPSIPKPHHQPDCKTLDQFDKWIPTERRWEIGEPLEMILEFPTFKKFTLDIGERMEFARLVLCQVKVIEKPNFICLIPCTNESYIDFYYYQKSADSITILATTDCKKWYPVAASISQFMADFDMLSVIRYIDWFLIDHDESADVARGFNYLEELQPLWPRDPKRWEYDFCQSCKKGKAQINTTNFLFKCKICPDYRICESCFDLQEDTLTEPVHEHQVKQGFYVRCIECKKSVPCKRGRYWECSSMFKHLNHFLCYECLLENPTLATQKDCKIVLDKDRSRRCDLCKIVILPHLLTTALTCEVCNISGNDSFDICPSCCELVMQNQRVLNKLLAKAKRHIQVYESSKRRPVKFAHQLNKKQLRELKSRKRSCKQRFIKATEIQTRIERFRIHTRLMEHNQWIPLVDDHCSSCDISCNPENYFCVNCKLILCPTCQPAQELTHLEHRVLHYIDGYLSLFRDSVLT